MVEHPLLFFPRAVVGDRNMRGGGGASVAKPSPEEQRERLEARFQELLESFQSSQETIEGAEPEMVVVFEAIGDDVAELAKAARQVEGLEWLAEIDLEDLEPAHGFSNEGSTESKLSCRLYAVMTNRVSLDRLVQLWTSWHQNPGARAESNFGPFKTIFAHLRDVRPWSVEDRLRDTGIIDEWEQDIQETSGLIRFEVELWCRESGERQQEAYRRLETLLELEGGRCISQCVLREISYYGILAELPARSVKSLLQQIRKAKYAELLRFDEVMFFRPFGQARIPSHSPEGEMVSDGVVLSDRALPNPALPPVVAVLDGLPLENHILLNGRITIDDPDDHAQMYEPSQQRHGTAMASLVCHGDLNCNEPSINRKVYFRPVFVPKSTSSGFTDEITPENRLVVDLIHRAVRRIVDRDNDEPPVAPHVKVINLSLGNRHQPFVRNLSPLARLLDWLAWKYQVLFIVSVGNQPHDVVFTGVTEWQSMSDDDRMANTLKALKNSQANRRPLSPSEAINVITVGAVHADDSQPRMSPHRLDLLAGARLPSPITTVAAGFQRLVLPTILMPGGRLFYKAPLLKGDRGVVFEPECGTTSPPGLKVAAPGIRPMELGHTIHTRGTSNATALATRTAALIHDRVLALRGEPGGDQIDDKNIAVLLKTLLIHGASWGDTADQIDEVFRDEILQRVDGQMQRYSHNLRQLKTRLFGYGEVQPNRSMFCTDQRVTLIGFGLIGEGQGHVYEVPLPESLQGSIIKRRLTVTLGWLTPVNFRHRRYRRARLWFDRNDEYGLFEELENVDADTARRGTIQHQIFSSEKAIVYGANAAISIKVNCDAPAGRLVETVPYALAVTLEIADRVLTGTRPIYSEVRAKVLTRIELQG